jgi:hypothetical protein
MCLAVGIDEEHVLSLVLPQPLAPPHTLSSIHGSGLAPGEGINQGFVV